MSQYVDSDFVNDAETLTEDNTIGITTDTDGKIEEEILVDTRRLRVALIEYENEVEESVASIGILGGDGPFKVLALKDHNGDRTVLLSGRVRQSDLDDRDDR